MVKKDIKTIVSSHIKSAWHNYLKAIHFLELNNHDKKAEELTKTLIQINQDYKAYNKSDSLT